MKDHVKKILLGIIFVVLLLPWLQHAFSFIKTFPLNGVFKIAPETNFSVAKWMDGSFQDEKSKYLNDNIDFRADLIRLNCQMDYSLFRKTNTGWGVFGKKGCLFDMIYIDEWTGADFIGYDTIRTKLLKLKAIQDTLGRLGKSLIFVHPASKAYYYADCIPDDLIPQLKKPTNFETCLRVGDSIGINQINFNSWFCAMRDTSKELLYPKGGIHWSFYGAMLAADSLVKYIERQRKIRMPHPVWRNITHTSEPLFTDNDISGLMNLIWPMAKETFTYGETYFNDTGQTKPSAIYIGDSFTWTIIDNWVLDGINKKWEFWFYMKELHKRGGYPRDPQSMENYDWIKAIDSTDYIVLIYTAASLKKIGSGFIEAAYDHYFPAPTP